MSVIQPLRLTSENLRKFERNLHENDKKENSLKRRTTGQRYEADGRSSGIQSYGSQLSAFKASLKIRSKHEKPENASTPSNLQADRKGARSLERATPETFRRNPEGQSTNEGSQAIPQAVWIAYEEESDRLSYATSSKDNKGSSVSDEDSDDDDDDDFDDDDGDSDNESDEDSVEDDESSDNETTTHSPTVSSTPVTLNSTYTSSIEASVSSIPTFRSEKSPLTSSRTTRTSKTGQATPHSMVSSAPSYVINSNQYRTKKLAARNNKMNEKLGISESELSADLERNGRSSGPSTREEGTSTERSRNSTVTVRNWSRWSIYSGAGYSINEGPEPAHHNKIQRLHEKHTTTKLERMKTSDLGAGSRAQTLDLRATGRIVSSKSEQHLKRADRRVLTIAAYPSHSRPQQSIGQVVNWYSGQLVSPMSTRSIIKMTTARRAKSLPCLARRAGLTFSDIEIVKGKPESTNGFTTKGSKRQTSFKSNKPCTFANRVNNNRQRKRVPRKRVESNASEVSSAFSFVRIQKSKETKYSRRPSADASAFLSRASRKGGVISIKPTLQPLRTYTAYRNDRSPASTPGSVFAPRTPISLIFKRSPSLRSVITEYSSYQSAAMSSLKSNRSYSSPSLVSTDGESTAVAPETNTPDWDKHDEKIMRHKSSQPRQAKRTMSPSKKWKKSNSDKKNERKTPSKSHERQPERALPLQDELQLPLLHHQSKKASLYAASVRVITAKNQRKTLKKTREKRRLKLPNIVRGVNHPMPNFEQATRDTGLSRLVKLAKPKESKAVWTTSFWPLVWGNQETMWPISRAALSANASERITTLAMPKKNFQLDHPLLCSRGEHVFSCGRDSVIWEVQPLALKANMSSRVGQLAEPKKAPPDHQEQREAYIFGCGRDSPIWQVSDAAKTAGEREWSVRLSQPKKPHPHYQPEREVQWSVSPPAKRAAASARVEQLARPKTRQDGLIREPNWRVASATKRTVASARVQELARPKQLAEGYLPCKQVAWPIAKSTLRATASERIHSMAKPTIRETMDHVQFNPDAFTVSEAAKKAKVSQRIAELAQPISRGFK